MNLPEKQTPKELARNTLVTEYQSLVIRDIDDAIATPGNSLIMYINNGQQMNVRGFIVTQLNDFFEGFLGRDNMTLRQYELFADDVMVHKIYRRFYLADIKLIFQRLRMGHYGKVPSNANMTFISEIFGQYWEERLSRGAEISKKLHQEQKNQEGVHGYKADTPAQAYEKRFKDVGQEKKK